MKIKIRVAHKHGWETIIGDAPDGSDQECYRLPRNASRAEFWSKRLGVHVPETRGMIWTVGS